jgi:hypothetical protein
MNFLIRWATIRDFYIPWVGMLEDMNWIQGAWWRPVTLFYGAGYEA